MVVTIITVLIENLFMLQDWAVNRQMSYEGGFQGRTNKLVDSCYSFWQAGIFPLIDMLINPQIAPAKVTENSNNDNNNSRTSNEDYDGSWLFVQRKLQEYLLMCCQDNSGGMRDKPGKSRDYYHTCYALSGLAISQHNKYPQPPTILGSSDNLLVCELLFVFCIDLT